VLRRTIKRYKDSHEPLATYFPAKSFSIVPIGRKRRLTILGSSIKPYFRYNARAASLFASTTTPVDATCSLSLKLRYSASISNFAPRSLPRKSLLTARRPRSPCLSCSVAPQFGQLHFGAGWIEDRVDERFTRLLARSFEILDRTCSRLLRAHDNEFRNGGVGSAVSLCQKDDISNLWRLQSSAAPLRCGPKTSEGSVATALYSEL
jgi:hypothetical protein